MNNPHVKSERLIECEVVENVDLSPANPGHFRLTINAPYIAENAKPGQFIHILPPSDADLLRRPISILGIDKESGDVTVLYRVIGDGTRLISKAGEGEKLDVIGPLGNGFPIFKDRSAILMGGGVGIPPLVYLAGELAGSMPASVDTGSQIRVILGARDTELLICVDDFIDMGIEPVVYLETGHDIAKKDPGDRIRNIHDGLITGFFETISDAGQNPGPVVYACGPIPMLKAVAKLASEHGLECYVSLENKLACGLGACLGCSISVRDEAGNIKYERVCTEGPVFDASYVAFDLM